MHSTQFIKKSSQTIQILRHVLEKIIDFYDRCYALSFHKPWDKSQG